MRHIREHLEQFRPKSLREPPAPAPVKAKEPDPADRQVGRITLFDHFKGFGFVKPDNAKDDVFFGRREAYRAGQLSVGNRVEYRVSLGANGRLSAVDLVKL
jgi:cold shock CspA family protein